MKHYKYLVMSISEGHAMFLKKDLSGGGRCCDPETNVTHFTPHDFGGGHQNDDYWNTPEELLVGFSRWYVYAVQCNSYNMGNRIYSANTTYRFFRVDEDLDQLHQANNDLLRYEISEEAFISGMMCSWEVSQVMNLFNGNKGTLHRPKKLPTKVHIVLNWEKESWCWTSDYLRKEDYKHLTVTDEYVPLGLSYEDSVKYISDLSGYNYRFGGNDRYLEEKNNA